MVDVVVVYPLILFNLKEGDFSSCLFFFERIMYILIFTKLNTCFLNI